MGWMERKERKIKWQRDRHEERWAAGMDTGEI